MKMRLAVTAACVLALGVGSVAHAQAVRRGWIPTADFDSSSIGRGDMYTFKCPSDFQFFATAQDTNDNSGSSNIDLRLVVRDGAGNFIGSGDDELTCDFPEACGHGCPDVPASGLLNCGVGTHSIQVTDFGACTANGGGGYVLSVSLFDKNGVLQSAKKTNLGGGESRSIPKWFDPLGLRTHAPVLDDEELPN